MRNHACKCVYMYEEKINEKTLLKYKPWIIDSKDHRAIGYYKVIA